MAIEVEDKHSKSRNQCVCIIRVELSHFIPIYVHLFPFFALKASRAKAIPHPLR